MFVKSRNLTIFQQLFYVVCDMNKLYWWKCELASKKVERGEISRLKGCRQQSMDLLKK